MPEITCELKKPVGVLSTSNSGWKKELNLVSWNHGPVRADIREWSPDKKSMTKGITLYKSEVYELKKYLDILDLSLIDERPLNKSLSKQIITSCSSEIPQNDEEITNSNVDETNYEEESNNQVTAVAEGI